MFCRQNVFNFGIMADEKPTTELVNVQDDSFATGNFSGQKSQKDIDRVNRLKALSIKIRSSYFPDVEQVETNGVAGQPPIIEQVAEVAVIAEKALKKPGPPHQVKKPPKRKKVSTQDFFGQIFGDDAR